MSPSRDDVRGEPAHDYRQLVDQIAASDDFPRPVPVLLHRNREADSS
jgi:hypothetical protein